MHQMNNDIFRVDDLVLAKFKDEIYYQILGKIDYSEETSEEKEKKMNKLQGQKIDKIEIVRDGDEVVAKAYKRSNITDCSGYSYGQCWSFVTRASAKCGPNDIFDFNIGAKLAIDRLYEGYDMTPKPKRKPYNGKIFVEEYPGNALKSHKIYQVRNGCIQPATIERDPYIFEDMNDGDLSVAVHATLWDSSIKNIAHPLLFCGTRAYFVKE